MRKPKVKLIGEDGNVFSIIGRVSKTLKLDGQRERANEFMKRAFEARCYDEVLRLVSSYCIVD